jgi:hypothetical protein
MVAELTIIKAKLSTSRALTLTNILNPLGWFPTYTAVLMKGLEIIRVFAHRKKAHALGHLVIIVFIIIILALT